MAAGQPAQHDRLRAVGSGPAVLGRLVQLVLGPYGLWLVWLLRLPPWPAVLLLLVADAAALAGLGRVG